MKGEIVYPIPYRYLISEGIASPKRTPPVGFINEPIFTAAVNSIICICIGIGICIIIVIRIIIPDRLLQS